MPFELPNPASRPAIDIMVPISAQESFDHTAATESLANRATRTLCSLEGRIGERLPGGYSAEVNVVDYESCNHGALIIHTDEEIDSISELAHDAHEYVRETRIGVSLRPPEGYDDQPSFAVDASLNHVTVLTSSGIQPIVFGDEQFVVQHIRQWDLSREDAEASTWYPEYFEDFVIVEGIFEGMPLEDYLRSFHPELLFDDKKLHTIDEMHDEQAVWQRAQREIKLQIQEATGITYHEVFGQQCLSEAHDVLETIELFLAAN